MSQLVLPFSEPPRPLFTRTCAVCGGAWRNYPRDHSKPIYTYVMQRQWWYKIGKSYYPIVRLRELTATNRQRYIICPPEMDRAEPLRLIQWAEGDIEHELH